LKRRKLFVIVGMCIMAISFLLLAFFQTWIAVVLAAAVLGFGLGAYLAVDVAIVTLVLPSAKNRAKGYGHHQYRQHAAPLSGARACRLHPWADEW
jgi:MFS family permease